MEIIGRSNADVITAPFFFKSETAGLMLPVELFWDGGTDCSYDLIERPAPLAAKFLLVAFLSVSAWGCSRRLWMRPRLPRKSKFVCCIVVFSIAWHHRRAIIGLPAHQVLRTNSGSLPIFADPPRLVLRQALGCRLALRLIGKSPAAVLFSHDLTLSEGFKKIRQGFGLSVAQFDCDGGQVALDFGP
jgi:hypothetical protein